MLNENGVNYVLWPLNRTDLNTRTLGISLGSVVFISSGQSRRLEFVLNLSLIHTHTHIPSIRFSKVFESGRVH